MLRALTVLALLAPATAAAQAGAYGRLDGDLTIELGLGGGATFEGELVSGAPLAEFRLRYLDTAGLFVGGEWRPEGASRVLMGADVRPLFLARFFLGATVGDRWVDLFLDSIGIDLGVALAPLEPTLGAALAVGFGVDLPLAFFGSGIEGLSLRLFGRHVASLGTDRVAPDPPLNDWIVGGILVLRLQAETGLTGWAPRRYHVRDPGS